MPVFKGKTGPENTRGPSLSTVRQQIRRKLIEVGLQVQIDHKKIQNLKQQKQKSKERTFNKDNLPLLQFNKQHNLPLPQYKQGYSNYSEREGLRKFSKEIVQGKRYDQTVQSSREKSSCVIKQSLLSRLTDDAKQKQDGLIPWLKKFEIYKNSKSSQGQPLSNGRLFESKNKKQITKQLQETSKRRSKTEQKQICKYKLRDKQSEIRLKEISPWQFQIARDTHVHFHFH